MKHLLALILVGCATATPVPLPVLPPLVDIGTLVPAPTALVVPASVPRYQDVNVRRGQCPNLPAGILVSPAVYAEQLDVVMDRKRLRIEVAALERLRVDERQAAQELAQTCRARTSDLAGQIDRTARWAPWRLAGAFLVGVAAGVLFRVGTK